MKMVVNAMRPDIASAHSDSSHGSPASFPDVAVGDVVVRRYQSGYGIFSYRGELVLDATLRTPTEAERLAAEIVSPWRGRVRVDIADR